MFVKQDPADADRLIVSPSSLDMGIHILCHRNTLQLYNIDELQSAVGDIKQHLMFVHTSGGCDTVSAPFMKGKKRDIELLRSYGENFH